MINSFLKEKLKNLKVIIAVHEFALQGGAAQELEKFFLNNNSVSLLFISHPLLNKDLNLKGKYKIRSHYRYFKHKQLEREHSAPYLNLPAILLYFKDFFYTLFWSKGTNERYDLFVGYDPLNAIAGVVLKKLGIVKQVVYYSVDYFPNRFENKIMNRIYHEIDKLCVRYSDETWNVGSLMADARDKNNNMKREIYNKQYYVPIGVWFDQVKRKPFEKVNKRKLIYAGHLAPHMGVELIIKAMPKLIKNIPNVYLEIIGVGESDEEIRSLAKDLGVFSHITFYGWIGDRKEFEKHLLDGAIGLAPFTTQVKDQKVINADPGKLKDYMYCGMSIITTRMVATYKEIENEKAGIIINYDVDEMVNAVLKLLQNEQLLREYRENALRYVKQFDWNKIFGKNLERLLAIK